MIVWGGAAVIRAYLNTGGSYDPSTDELDSHQHHRRARRTNSFTAAVWTGSEMIVWGGDDLNSTFLNTGGRYDPSTDSWTATSIYRARPVARDPAHGSLGRAAR